MTDVARAIAYLRALAIPPRLNLPRPIAEAFDREERFAITLVTVLRTLAVAVISIWVIIQNWELGPLGVGYFVGLMVIFALLGLAHLALARSRHRRDWHKFLFLTLDVVFLTYIFIQPYPFGGEPIPPPMMLRWGNFLYFFVLLAQTVVMFSPVLALWFGLNVIFFWSAGFVSILLRGGNLYFDEDSTTNPDIAEQLAVSLRPDFVHIEVFITQIVVITVVSAIVAVALSRARRLVYREAEAQRARTNLARYFSPNMVKELSGADELLMAGRSQNAAVLFADIVGFTTLSERLSPPETLALLRNFHGRMAEAVFAHGGTLDKYVGDEVMATFGTPRPGLSDASNALACARAMQEAISTWNRERRARGEPAIALGIGLHFGPVVLGDIGGEQRFEFAVIGDTVNVASRLERLTRELGVGIVAADPLIQATKAELGERAMPLLEGLMPAAEQSVRGREGRIGIWTQGRPAQPQ